MSHLSGASRMRMLLENYVEARKEGKVGGYDLRIVKEDQYEHYYILFKPTHGVYKDQTHILEMKTLYGNGVTGYRHEKPQEDAFVYPNNAPAIRFLTKMYHVNVSTEGTICLDILKDANKWSPSYGFTQILLSIVALLQSPNTSSPFNGDASNLWTACQKLYDMSTKDKKLTIAETEAMEEKCFAEFKAKADKHASINKLETYAKWFPQIVGKSTDENDIELISLEEMVKSLRIKKKEESSDNKVANPAKKINRYAKYQK
jgi:ubiquitin-protein ligase